MNRINILTLFGVILLMTSAGNSIGGEQIPTIKIIYEINGGTFNEDKSASSELQKNDPKLKYDKVFKDSTGNRLLQRNDDNYFKEVRELNKEKEKLDAKKVSRELYEALKNGFMEKGFRISDEQESYVVSFVVNEIAYDDYKGECYIKSANYKLSKGTSILYEGNFLPEKKKTWFSRGEYTQLTKVSRIANKIVNEISGKIFPR